LLCGECLRCLAASPSI